MEDSLTASPDEAKRDQQPQRAPHGSQVHLQAAGLDAETKISSASSRRRGISLDISFNRTMLHRNGFFRLHGRSFCGPQQVRKGVQAQILLGHKHREVDRERCKDGEGIQKLWRLWRSQL